MVYANAFDFACDQTDYWRRLIMAEDFKNFLKRNCSIGKITLKPVEPNPKEG